MARPGRTESASLPIWLKLSEADAEQMGRVLARPEFAGWTRAEWCLEIIQTALRYYARRDAADEPGQQRASARPATAGPEPATAGPEPATAGPEPAGAGPEPAGAGPESAGAGPEPASAAKPGRAAPKSRRATSRARSAVPKAERPAPETQRSAPGRAARERAAAERAAAERAAAERAACEPERPPPEPTVPEGQGAVREPEAGPELLDPPECSHPAEARDYQTGTCGACGAILWD